MKYGHFRSESREARENFEWMRKLERLVNREQTALLPVKSRSPKIVLLVVCYDTARFSLIQLFLGTFDSYSTDDPTSKTS